MKDQHMEKIMIARKAILEDLKRRFSSGDKTVIPLNPENAHRWHKPQDNYFCGQGTFNCPVCNSGLLSYSRASYNGHVHAKCNNAGCVCWME